MRYDAMLGSLLEWSLSNVRRYMDKTVSIQSANASRWECRPSPVPLLPSGMLAI